MKQRSETQAAPAAPSRPLPTLPCWRELPPEQRQALIIALTTMIIKWLPERQRSQEVNDG